MRTEEALQFVSYPKSILWFSSHPKIIIHFGFGRSIEAGGEVLMMDEEEIACRDMIK